MAIVRTRLRRTEQPPDDGAGATAAPPWRSRLRRWWRKRPIKKSIVWTHRWAALVLGLVLLLICTSGVPLLYTAEINRATHSSAYDASDGPTTVSFAEARDSIRQHAPNYEPESIWLTNNTYVAMNYVTGRHISVDGTTGTVLGDYNANSGAVASTMSFLVNFHDCFLSCEDYLGYVKWFADPVPGTSSLGFDGEKMTWGGLFLGVTGVLLVFLALSGIWLWWPGVKRWIVGVRVRLRRGRYARDFDLHQVAGMIAMPLLLVWAVTAMGFEFGFVEKAWYQALPGEASAEVEFTSKKSSAADIDLAAAQAAAAATVQRVVPGVRGPSGVDFPIKDDESSAYNFWFQDGFDPYAENQYPGNVGVNVDRRDASRTAVTYGLPDQSTAELLYNDYNFTVHAGWLVGPWWRVIWAVLGLVPLLLAVTGLSTRFYKRGVRKRRRQAVAAA